MEELNRKFFLWTLLDERPWHLTWFASNSTKSVILNGTFKQLGVPNRVWRNLGDIKNCTEVKRAQWLDKIVK